MILKQVIRYDNADALEATWVEQIQLPDVEIPATPAEYDEDGNETKPAQPARTEPGGIQEIVVKCQAYANSQMDMLAADLGADAPQYQALMDEVAATYVPPPPTPRPEVNAAIWEQIKATRDRKTQHGGYKVGTDWYHSDTFSRTQQIGLTIMGAAMPAGLMWKTMSGVFVEMTPTLAQQIFAAAGAQDAALFGHAEQLKAQVEAATDPTTVDINTGWPETFNGI